jgi:glyoxylase-like metal-dependent hydrolase (beta-lactamase superfamily II)
MVRCRRPREYRLDNSGRPDKAREFSVLEQVADGVFVHVSEFIQSNTTVVQGREGVLLIDPGITRAEMIDLTNDLRERGQPVVAGFSTHPDWDHVLWHANFGVVPRYGTAQGAATIRRLLASPDWQEQIAPGLPPEYAEEIPMELLGFITGLPAGATQIPWDGPTARILEHRAHAPGHAALLIEESGVLVAGDMLSDILMPFLDLEAAHPIDDYLEALRLLEGIADEVRVVIPGHGAVGGADQVRARIDLDRVYVQALRAGRVADDPRVGPSAPLEWLADVSDWQLRQLADK